MRYALVIVVEAETPDAAWDGVELAVTPGGGVMVGGEAEAVYLGNPCEVPDADEYATAEIHLLGDGFRRVVKPL